MSSSEIKSLDDLNQLRSAPVLDQDLASSLMDELTYQMNNADWFTVGIMAPSSKLAISTLKEIESYFSWSTINIIEEEFEDGPVFLKANQKTGDAHLRLEHGLGEGILISCQRNEENKNTNTFGPFPLKFFRTKD